MSFKVISESAKKNWAPLLKEKLEITDNYKLGWLSEMCHNQAIHEQSLNESFAYSSAATLGNVPGQGSVRPGAAPGGPISFYTGSTGSGDKFPALLPIAIQVAARTVGFDVVSVIPMSGPAGVLAYMDYHYTGGRTGTEEQPLVIKIKADNINSADYTVGNVYWGLSAQSDGTNWTNGTKVVEMIFVGYSFIDGYPIFRIGSTYEMSSNTLASNEKVTLKEIFDSNAIIAADNAGVPAVTNATTHRVVVTSKPQLVKALEDHIQGYGGAGTYDQDTWKGPWVDGTSPSNPMGRGTGENTYYRTMGLQVYTKFIEAETFQYAATVTTEQIQDLNKQWGMDVVSMVENALINEISQSINKHILTRLFALGWTNNSQVYKTEKVTLNFTTDKADTTAGTTPAYMNKLGFTETLPVPAFQNFGDFENMSTIQRRIKSKCLAAGNLINQRSRRGRGNFIVTNIQVASALQDAAQYTFAPMNNTINQENGSLYPVGSVAGMTIYVDPNMKWNDNRILVGRKGADDEPGVKFMPYLMAESIQTIAEGTMAPKLAVKSRYALVEAGHWPENMYYTIYLKTPAAGII